MQTARQLPFHIDDSVPRPVITGTDIKVSQVAREVEQMGMSPREVVEAHPHLSLADVHAALSYYFDHLELIQRDWELSDELVRDLRAKNPAHPKLSGA